MVLYKNNYVYQYGPLKILEIFMYRMLSINSVLLDILQMQLPMKGKKDITAIAFLTNSCVGKCFKK